MSVDLRRLRHAIAAADHGSFYRAAQSLDVDQSTLSRSVSKLERALGAPIFTRSRSGVELTCAGRTFIQGARPMVVQADRLIAAMRAAGQGRAGKLIMGLNSSVSAGKLRAALVSWVHENPGVHIELVEAERGTLMAGLNMGEIDIAILMGEATQNGFRRETFWSEQMLLAVPTSHALARREFLHWTDLRQEKFAISAADPGPDISDMLRGRWAMSGCAIEIKIYRTSRETLLSLLGEGDHLSLVCEGSSGTLYPDVSYKPIHGERGPALIAYSGYWRSENSNPLLRRFLVFVRQRYALSFGLLDDGAVRQQGG